MTGDDWDALVTAAVLGTDRRPPPDLAAGPVADVVADAVERDPARRLLVAIAAAGAARAAAFRPGPPVPPPPAPVADPRPWCTPAAVQTWTVIRRDWPVLEDEWLREVVRGGWRLPPDVTVRLLERHRGDRERRRWVVRAAGPTADWLADLVPSLRARVPHPAAAEVATDPALPPLPLPPALVAVLDGDAGRVLDAIGDVIEGPGSPAAHRATLVHLLARCRADVVGDVARRLRRLAVPPGWSATVLALVEVAELRDRLRTELAPAGHRASPVTPRR